MLEFKDETYRNLEEQVEWLTEQYGKLCDGVSAALGFMPHVLGVYSSIASIPAGSYNSGDTFLIGDTAPYIVFIYTDKDEWQDIGRFPVAGPQGAKGEIGSRIYYGATNPTQDTFGDNGDYYINSITGDWYIMTVDGWEYALTLKGEQGKRGEQGFQGEPGKQGEPGVPGKVQDVLVNNSSVVDESTGVANIDLSGYLPKAGGALTADLYMSYGDYLATLSNNGISFAKVNESITSYSYNWITAKGHRLKFPEKAGTLALADDMPTLKTIFGNKSLTGSGNIDLYRHNIVILAGIGQYAIGLTVIDSNISAPVDSLTDLIALLTDKGSCSASGYTGNGVVYSLSVRDNLCYISTVATSGGTYGKVLGTDVAIFSITDTVTTI